MKRRKLPPPPGQPAKPQADRVYVRTFRDKASGKVFWEVWLDGFGRENVTVHQDGQLYASSETAEKHGEKWIKSREGQAAIDREVSLLPLERHRGNDRRRKGMDGVGDQDGN